MQRLKSIWNASPFSWQGIRARWRYLLAAGLLLLILLGVGYALRFRAAPGEAEANLFATLAAEQQGRLTLMELSLRFERLRELVDDSDPNSITMFYSSLLRNLETSLGTERWTELEPQLNELSAQLGRSDPAAVTTIDDIIVSLRQ